MPTNPRTQPRSTTLLAASLALVVSGCSGFTTSDPATPTPPTPPAPRPVTAEAVADWAVRWIEPCALLADPRLAPEPGFEPHPTGPTSCSVTTPSDRAISNRFEVWVGAPFDTGRRVQMRPVEIGGLRAYLLQQVREGTGRLDMGDCEYMIPLSATRGVDIKADAVTRDLHTSCQEARVGADIVVARLTAHPSPAAPAYAPPAPDRVGFTPDEPDDVYLADCVGAGLMAEDCGPAHPVAPPRQDPQAVVRAWPKADFACGILRETAAPLLEQPVGYAASVSGALCGVWEINGRFSMTVHIWPQNFASCFAVDGHPVTVAGHTGVSCAAGNSEFGDGGYRFPVHDAAGKAVGSVDIDWDTAWDTRGVFDLDPISAADRARADRLSAQITTAILTNYFTAPTP